MKDGNLDYPNEQPKTTLVFHIFDVRSYTLHCMKTILKGVPKNFVRIAHLVPA